MGVSDLQLACLAIIITFTGKVDKKGDKAGGQSRRGEVTGSDRPAVRLLDRIRVDTLIVGISDVCYN